MLSRIASLLWLVTALAVMQWSAPSVDPSVLQRLLAGPAGEATLGTGEHDAVAVLEARTAPSVVVEKRTSGGRPLSAGCDDTGIAGAPVMLCVGAPVGSAEAVPQSGPPRAAVERPFTARSPPARA